MAPPRRLCERELDARAGSSLEMATVELFTLALGVAVSPTLVPRTAPPTARPPLELLTSTPEDLRDRFGDNEVFRSKSGATYVPSATGKQDKAFGIWQVLRKGMDPLASADEQFLAKPAHLERHVPPRLRRALLPECAPVLAGATPVSEARSQDGTVKLLLELSDGLKVECVVIPISGKHTSLCVSSQVGCSRGCTFCSTGTMGLVRNLKASEILAQVWLALKLVRERGLPPLVNVVFMGMGEPLNNLGAVGEAVRMLVHPDAFRLSRRNVCVSTVGPSPALIRRAGLLPCRLAWSVHAVDDDLRKALVPTTNHPMAELREAFADALGSRTDEKTQGLLVELALLRGVNDQAEHAEALADFLARSFGRNDALVNLIPYNENGLGLAPGEFFQRPRLDDVYAFQRRLWSHGRLCTVRAQRGDDESSACGQLVVGDKREAREERVSSLKDSAS